MQHGDRRRHPRHRVALSVDVQTPRGGGSHRLVSLSEDGAFVLGLPSLAIGDRATLRFTDPGSGRPISSRAIVSRTTTPGRGGALGAGFFLLDDLSSGPRTAERRASERHATDLKAELELGGRRHFARILDLGIAGACVSSRVRVAPGRVGRLRFTHPVTGAVATARIFAAWPAVAVPGSGGWYRQGFRLIDSLPALAEEPSRGSGALPRSDVVLPTSDRTMDDVRTRELVMRKLLRGVVYRDAEGTPRRGRLVLASKKTALVAGPRPPKVGDTVQMALETPAGSGFPSLKFLGEVVRSGPRLVAGNEPGCVVAVQAFRAPADRRRWSDLVDWLVQRTR